jgi:hypothetical protein
MRRFTHDKGFRAASGMYLTLRFAQYEVSGHEFQLCESIEMNVSERRPIRSTLSTSHDWVLEK